MRDSVNEVLEQMNDKYIAEAADFQAEKRSICPRVVAVALIAACLMGLTAVAYSQGWVFERGGPEVWADVEAEAQMPTAEDVIPPLEYNYRVRFTTEAYDRFTDEQLAFLDAHYGETLIYANLAEVQESLGMQMLMLSGFDAGEQINVKAVGSRSTVQYKQVLTDYELAQPAENLRVVMSATLKTNGVQEFSVGGSYARPIEEMEYWVEVLETNAKLVSPESKESDAASVVWAYFTYDNMAYTLQIIDKDVPAEKMAEACALLEILHK